jgi:predicted DNA-binding protein (MmcQ/YjbR family)
MAEAVTKRTELLTRLREICLPLPECKEKLAWGNPTFVAGKKQFAALDRYHGRWCIAFVAQPEVQRELVRRDGFFPAPYSAKYGWVCRDAEGRVGWKELEKLIVESYRKVALKRMLVALDRK